MFHRPIGGKDFFHDGRFVRSGDKEENLAGIIDDGKRDRNSPSLERGNKNRNDAPALFIQRGTAGEERGDVAVLSEPEKDQIESRDGMCEESHQFDSIFLRRPVRGQFSADAMNV